MAPPTHTPKDVALFGMTLVELLAVWLFTRQWHRDKRADELEILRTQVHMQALIAGHKAEDADKLTNGLTQAIERLREPEWKPDQYQFYSPAQQAFFNASLRQQAIQAGRLPAPE